MKLLTENARITCKHLTGVVQIKTPLPLTQGLVTIRDHAVLVKNDLEKKLISGCANMGMTIKPCNFTLSVKGYSELVFIDRQPVCLDTITGLTDGTPPGMVEYLVRTPGQDLVEAEK